MEAVVAAPGAVVGGLVVVDGVRPPAPPHEPQNGPGRLLPAWGGGVRRVRQKALSWAGLSRCSSIGLFTVEGVVAGWMVAGASVPG